MKQENKINKKEIKITEELIKENLADLTLKEQTEIYLYLLVLHAENTVIMLLEDMVEKSYEIIQENVFCKSDFTEYEGEKGIELFMKYEQLSNYLESTISEEVLKICILKMKALEKVDKIKKILEQFKNRVKKVQEEALNIDKFRRYDKYPQLVKELNLQWEKVFEVVEYIIQATTRTAIRECQD